MNLYYCWNVCVLSLSYSHCVEEQSESQCEPAPWTPTQPNNPPSKSEPHGKVYIISIVEPFYFCSSVSYWCLPFMYRLLDTFDVSDCCHSLARGDSSASRGLGKKEKQHKGLHVREGVGCGVLGHRHLRGKEPDWKGMPHHQDHQAAPHPAEAMGSERYVLSSTSHLLFVRYQVLGYLKCNIDDVIIKTRDGYRAPVLTGPRGWTIKDRGTVKVQR